MMSEKTDTLSYETMGQYTVPEIKVLLRLHYPGKKTFKGGKKELVKQLLNAPPYNWTEYWTADNEVQSQQLMSYEVPMRDTALGVATSQIARAVSNNIQLLDEEAKQALRASLQQTKSRASSSQNEGAAQAQSTTTTSNTQQTSCDS